MRFQYTGADCDEAIDLAFNKKRTDDRKGWINNANDEDFVADGRLRPQFVLTSVRGTGLVVGTANGIT